MADNEVVCFDRVLPGDALQPHAGILIAPEGVPTRAAFQIRKLWPNGKRLRIRFMDGSQEQHQRVQEIATQWTEYANLSFDFGEDDEAEIRIAFRDDGAWSWIGTDALRIAPDRPTMNLGWYDPGTILHEFGHMLGMIHEHQNPVGPPIQWNREVVNTVLSGPPNHWSQAKIDHNMYDRYSVDQVNGSRIDPQSVMMYSFPSSWTLDDFHTQRNLELSELDIEFARRVYPGEIVPVPVRLPVWTPVKADIAAAGEEDQFTFVTDEATYYTIQTTGPTDLVLTLYGPNGNVIAQDDDSGDGYNPRLRKLLSIGEHKIQVRHYNQAGGTGEYAIQVVKG